MNGFANRPISVLIIDDEDVMRRELIDSFERYNQGRLPLPDHVRELGLGHVIFKVEPCSTVDEAQEKLRGMVEQWDVFIIDRRFGGLLGEDKDIYLLESLRDVGSQGIRIVWSGYAELAAKADRFTPNIVQCMRLGAWDYLNKNSARHGNTYTDVIVSALEGLAARQRHTSRAEADVEPNRFVTEHFTELYNAYKGQFVAFARDPVKGWEPLAAHASLYGLYSHANVANRDRATLHVAMIRELVDAR